MRVHRLAPCRFFSVPASPAPALRLPLAAGVTEAPRRRRAADFLGCDSELEREVPEEVDSDDESRRRRRPFECLLLERPRLADFPFEETGVFLVEPPPLALPDVLARLVCAAPPRCGFGDASRGMLYCLLLRGTQSVAPGVSCNTRLHASLAR